MKLSVLLVGLLSAGIAFAGPPAPKQEGIEGKNACFFHQPTGQAEVIGMEMGDDQAVHRSIKACQPFETGVLRGEVRAHTGSTPYIRWGDWPAILLILSCLLAGFAGRRKR